MVDHSWSRCNAVVPPETQAVEDDIRRSISLAGCHMKGISPDVSASVLILECALICVMVGCAEAPQYYWVKSGTTTEQIRKDNMYCADMTAEKPSAYARGSAFYYASLDQPAYQRCMQKLGYRKLTEEELNRERVSAAAGPLLQLDNTRKLCQRVMGSDGNIESCVRYMSMHVTDLQPSALSEYEDSPKQPSVAASQMDHLNVCLRRESYGPTQWNMIVDRNCREHPRSAE